MHHNEVEQRLVVTKELLYWEVAWLRAIQVPLELRYTDFDQLDLLLMHVSFDVGVHAPQRLKNIRVALKEAI